MLGWLTGSSPTTGARYAGRDDGASYIDEPPETPAPLFAIRAFKTAIFGTPAPSYRQYSSHEQPKEEESRGPDVPILNNGESQVSRRDGDIRGDNITNSKPATNPKPDSLASPAKGILLTPGTAATRRKTVSFGALERKKDPTTKASTECDRGVDQGLVMKTDEKDLDVAPSGKPRQSTLTKTLIELSKQNAAERDGCNGATTKEKRVERAPSIDFQTESVRKTNADITVDLNQPRSISGQHWKTEYDHYHRRSNREMKKIIKYGQNVRSYASKKDTEATKLSERLRKQMAKTAEMEAKVESLANELRNFQPSQVTHAAQGENLEEGKAKGFRRLSTTKDAETQTLDLMSSRRELESLRETAKTAEDKAARLEKENDALKLSLARVKNEMMSYETRRQAREERMKEREAKHKAAKEECEKKLAMLTIEHEELLRAPIDLPVVDMGAEVQSIQQEACIQIITGNEPAILTDPASSEEEENPQPLHDAGQISKPYISPRKKRLQKSTVDIWTIDSSQNGIENSPISKEPTELPPSSVKRDLHRTLKEIDQNLVPNQGPEKPQDNQTSPPKPQPSHRKQPLTQLQTASASRRMHNRKSTISSPRPSMISLESSPAKPRAENPIDQPTFQGLMATTGRSASLMSKAGSRTSTMGSARVSSLPAERVSAAKQRLARRMAQRRREGHDS